MWRRFNFAFVGQKKQKWRSKKYKTEMGMVVGEFLFLVTKSRRLNLLSNYEICLQNFSFSSRNRRNNFWISPSLLHTREIIADFSFFLQKFLFSSRTRKQISTFLFSLLEIRGMDSIFLFLFSISFFDISSMPAVS